ncbi:MAG: DUF3795 domain-containing protein [Oscillospiraceae bacterium]
MDKLIGCCGLDCEKCDARIATVTDDDALREKTATMWTKLNGVTIAAEMINCTGCRIEGAKTPFCDKLCPVHNCRPGARTGRLRRLRTDGRLPNARAHRRQQPVHTENLKCLCLHGEANESYHSRKPIKSIRERDRHGQGLFFR